MNRDRKIGIIGGGMLGMALSGRLSSMGYKVSLIEANTELGGLAGTWQFGDIRWDRFYHVISNSDKFLIDLLYEIGVYDSIKWVETKTGFFSKGKLYSMSNIYEFMTFPPLGLIGKIRLGLTIWVASRIKNWQRLEKIHVETWLTKWSGRKTFDLIWLPLLKSKLGDSYKETSASFIWATIQRMYNARRSGLKKEMFGYVKGGYHTIIRQFEKTLKAGGVVVKTNLKTNSVYRSDSGISVEYSDGNWEEFDNVIVTIPSKIALDLCQQLRPDEQEKHRNVRYLGVVCPTLVLTNSLTPYYVTNITDSGFPFTGVIEMSALVEKNEFNGHALIYLPKYALPEDPVFSMDDEELESLFLASLRNIHPELKDDDVLFSGTSRARYVFALPVLNYSRLLPPVKTSVKGLFILNSAHIINGTLNVNQTLQLVDGHLDQIVSAFN
jgi:protoporphyrinogen oxidase